MHPIIKLKLLATAYILLLILLTYRLATIAIPKKDSHPMSNNPFCNPIQTVEVLSK